uniref:F-box/kelch-repeat protein At3g23880-like n=1 Tax=Erigeron canadensis TaxID=72917 RepID=UPI001CB9AB29|nr:F-box/kelch-repeat protein At3g23880-like [Erigeron canadensis]
MRVDILFIWNPSTRISTTFVAPPSWRCKKVYGFAYDKATNDYKVVAVSINEKKSVKIYSLKTGNWKHIGDFPQGYLLNVSGVFLNGYLHWMATHRGATRLNYPCTIVSLNLANETYGEVSQPVYDEDDKVLTLGALGEWLCVFCNYRLVTRADISVMKVYGVQDSWTKLVSVSYPFNFDSPHYLSFFISNDGTILLQSRWDLVVCYSNHGSSSKIKYFDRCDYATTFVESLVSSYVTS